MKLIVFGSTGGIGRQVVAQALEASHQVTAMARHPDYAPLFSILDGLHLDSKRPIGLSTK
jgi:uncharacterized protein YbjT (DUF2867 family)